MAKFNITVTRTDEYIIDIDESVYTKEALEAWSEVFATVENIEDFAKDFAVAWMRNEDKYFIEGYGYVKEFMENGTLKGIPYRKEDGSFGFPMPVDHYAKGISITPVSQDDDYETELETILP